MKVTGILDIQNMPCARESILHGAAGSLVAGLVHFLATSKWFNWCLICWYVTYFFSVRVFSAVVLSFTGRVKRSFDVGVAGFMLTTLGSWYVLQKQKTAYILSTVKQKSFFLFTVGSIIFFKSVQVKHSTTNTTMMY